MHASLHARAAVRTVLLACAIALSAGHLAVASAVTTRIAIPTSRVYGLDAYSTAEMAARRAYPGWHGVSDVVVASGETAALPEAIAASSLCWAYDSPLLLTRTGSLPAVTRAALAQIASENPTLTIHVVGSSTSVPVGRITQIKAAAPGAVVEQPWPRFTRFALATAIAKRVAAVAAANGSTVPSIALVADATSGRPVWDALASATVSRRTGIPVYFVSGGSIPAATASALFGSGRRVIVVGGSRVVPATVFAALSARERWAGLDRFGTAAVTASRSIERGWSLPTTVAVAASPAGVLAGAQLVGRQGGSVLLTTAPRVEKRTWYWLASRGSATKRAFAVGTGISDGQVIELAGAPALPSLSPSTTGRYVAKRARLTGSVGGNTTSVEIYAGDVMLRRVTVTPWGRFDVADLPMPSGAFTIRALARNGASSRAAVVSRAARRVSYSPSTCIIIVKSKFRLFWIHGDRLVKIYPIAIGREHLETPAPATWKILQKYHTDPGSVYGPRKMRLFRKRGGSYVFSRYGIHGTNEPWVIGTKASHGCIRMYNRDVRELYPQVPMGTLVFTRL